MCLIVFAWQCHPDFPLILAANRDEFWQRPALPAAAWDDSSICGGRDLQGGGTWLAVGRDGRFGTVTNFRSKRDLGSEGPTRGLLVSRFLQSEESPLNYLAHVTSDPGYRGFNLLLGSARELAYGSNRGAAPQAVAAGIHGLSNALLDTPWPKVMRARQGLSDWLAAGRIGEEEALFRLLADRSPAADSHLPDTGIGPEWERSLSPIFIRVPERAYGTRCSSLLFLHRDGGFRLVERRFDTAGRPTGADSIIEEAGA